MSQVTIDPNLYQNLGESGLKISKIIVGCMSFGNKKWSDWVIEDEEQIFGILKKCYDNNLRTFDTADAYSNGLSEIILGKFLKKYNIRRDTVVILSKLYFPVDPNPDGPNNMATFQNVAANTYGLSRKHIFDAAELSVERLGTYMDVLQIHRFDRATPPREIMRALNDVVEKGYTRYIGASSMKAYEFAILQHTAEKYDYHKFISMQSYYNLLYREDEREMIPFCDLTKVGLIPWSPNARGVLTRPVKKDETSTRFSKDGAIKALGLNNLTEAEQIIVERVEEIAKKKNLSMALISTAWVLLKGGCPIVGISKEERVDDYLFAVDLKLSEAELKYLEEPYQPKEFMILG